MGIVDKRTFEIPLFSNSNCSGVILNCAVEYIAVTGITMLPEIIPPVSEPLPITFPLNFIISPSKVLNKKVDSFKKFNLSDLTVTIM